MTAGAARTRAPIAAGRETGVGPQARQNFFGRRRSSRISAAPNRRLAPRSRVLSGPLSRVDFDRQMRQSANRGEPRAVVVRPPALTRRHRQNGAEMAGAQTPEMEIGNAVAAAFYDFADLGRRSPIRVHVEQDGAG